VFRPVDRWKKGAQQTFKGSQREPNDRIFLLDHLTLGIGLITYRRKSHAIECIRRIKEFTSSRNYHLLVAEDGGHDGTVEWCRDQKIPVISGTNSGVVWNKNRAIYVLKELLECDVVLLLEDDCWPNANGWEVPWVQASLRHGHINYAHPIRILSQPDAVLDGDGTAENPYLAKLLTGQCTGFSASAFAKVGYLDPRFRGYGYGHVEWTERFLIHHYGTGTTDGYKGRLYAGIHSGLEPHDAPTFCNQADLDRNRQIKAETGSRDQFLPPWRNYRQKNQLADEVTAMGSTLLQQKMAGADYPFAKPALPVPDMPAIPAAERERLERELARAKVYLEYGAGGTTALAARMNVENIISIETSAEWASSTELKIAPLPSNSNLHLSWVDVGPTREWGYPATENAWKRFWKYPHRPWEISRRYNLKPDLILIDGRFRIASFLTSLIYVEHGATILFDDYADRPHYHRIERILKPTELVGRMAIFNTPAAAPSPADILPMLAEAYTDPA